MRYIMPHLFADRVWCHAQDLRKDEARSGGPYGRAWLHIGRASWQVSWCLGRQHGLGFALTIDVGGESDVCLHIALPFLFSLHFILEGLIPYRWLPRNWSRQTGVRAFTTGGVGNDVLLCVDIWNDDSWGGRSKRRWQDICINISQMIFGRFNHETRPLGVHRVWVHLPEGPVPAKVEMFESIWTWPRLRRPLRMTRADITPDKPITVPGKGENSWDCDDDAVFGMTCPANIPQDAAVALAESVMRARRRRG